MDFREKVAEYIHRETNIPKTEILEKIEVPPDGTLGDYAFPCFTLAKQFKKSPPQIAQELQEKLAHQNTEDNHLHFEKIIHAGPYLNFFINKKTYNEQIIKKILHEKEQYGKGREKKTRVMIEHGQANTHKEFHVGHLRNVCLGDALVRIHRFAGYPVIAANYPGDIGTHVAKTLWCYLKFHKNDIAPENKGQYIGRIYAEANKRLEESGDPTWKEEVSQTLQKIESGDPELTAVWKETRQWSLDQFEQIFTELDVQYDVYFFESEVEQEGKKIVNDLLQRNIAIRDQGAVLVDLKPYNLDVLLILKKDGTSLYATKDLELAQRKFREYNIDKSFYVVDSRQSTYFRQLFKTLALMGFKQEMHHIPYEFVTTKEGAMSSREGNVILYEDLRDQMVAKLREETKKRHPEWNDEKINSNSIKIMMAALKFGMLKYDTNKTIVFDMDDWLSFEGETGPYILYAIARINSLFNKYMQQHDEPAANVIDAKSAENLVENSEFSLVKQLATYPEIVEAAVREYKPSIVSRYLLDTAQQFNEFYHAHQILTADKEIMHARLTLCAAAKSVLISGLEQLGIESVDEM